MFDSIEVRKAIGRKFEIRTRRRREALDSKMNEERERRLKGMSLEERIGAWEMERNIRLAFGSKRSVECLTALIEEAREALRREAERKQKESFLGFLFGG